MKKGIDLRVYAKIVIKEDILNNKKAEKQLHRILFKINY